MKTGRVPHVSSTAIPTSNVAAQSRLNRRNTAKQVQAQKRNALVSATKIFNGVDGAPRITAVIPLSEDLNARATIVSLAESLDLSADDCPQTGLWKIKCDFVHCIRTLMYQLIKPMKSRTFQNISPVHKYRLQRLLWSSRCL